MKIDSYKNANLLSLLKFFFEKLRRHEEINSVISALKNNYSLEEINEACLSLVDYGVTDIEINELIENLISQSVLNGQKNGNEIKSEKIVSKIKKQAQKIQNTNSEITTINLESIPGHPLRLFHKENNQIEKLIEGIKEELAFSIDISESLVNLLPIENHYTKKRELLYSYLMDYGELPHSIADMWTLDDEILEELKLLIFEDQHSKEWQNRTVNLIKRIEEMTYLEENILYPLVAIRFSSEDWQKLHLSLNKYPKIYNITQSPWIEGNTDNSDIQIFDNELILPGGRLSVSELQGILKTLPYEITFIDENDLNKYFNEGPKVFKNSLVDLGLNAVACHPPKLEKKIRSIIKDFRDNKLDKDTLWIEKDGKPFLLTYIAVRNNQGHYIGTLVTVQEMDSIEEYFEKKFA